MVHKLAVNTGDRKLQAMCLRSIALAELSIGLKAEFVETSLQLLDVATELQDPWDIALALKDLSLAYRLNMRYDQAVVEARRSLAMLLPLDNAQAVADAHQLLITSLLFADMHGEAMSAATAAMDACRDLNDEHCQATVHHLMARVLTDMGKQADALPFLTKAERVLKVNGTPEQRFQLAIDRGRTMLGLGLTHYAKPALDDAEALLPEIRSSENDRKLLELRYELAMAQEQWQPALHFLQRIKAQNDSLEVARMNMKMAGLQVIHETKTKEMDNELLRNMNAQQAETIADQRSSNQYLIALLAGLIILAVALFIISRYSLRIMRRLKIKNEVIRRQNEEIQGKVLELKRQNMRLAESLMSEEEKELILKEIHHRVKNNLQVVDSLLNIQANDVEDPMLHRMLKDAQGRIRSMAMVHEHIYRTSSDMHASLRVHFEKLGRSVLVAHGVHDRISISVETALPSFPIDTLLPLSLVVNELFTNSIKHAFTVSGSGNIKLRIKELGNEYELSYSDDGVGMASTAVSSKEDGFGRELITILAHQLNGKVEMLSDSGLAFRMTFTPDKEQLRMAG